ncbi:ABC transporter permease [Aestuariivirga sp.]|jgi:polar amino acid transport system permease protein|uniref:ABC transporter permease n=1 Tax=Aestuariivirga sp. TaxID=2650926 RepID=UPI00378387F3
MFPEILSFGDQGFGDELLRGTQYTLVIAVSAFLLGTVLGLLGAAAKLYGGHVGRAVGGIYTTVVRSVPELVLILILYFAGTRGINTLLGSVGIEPIEVNATLAAILVLGVVQGAYHTEVYRAAIQAVPQGQIEAGRAFGMGRLLIFRRVTGPAMLPNAIPGLSNLWLIVIKDTALVAVVGNVELLSITASAAAFTKKYMLFYLTTALIYLAITLISNYFIGLLERRYRRGQGSLA